jgi:hypothetical protein
VWSPTRLDVCPTHPAHTRTHTYIHTHARTHAQEEDEDEAEEEVGPGVVGQAGLRASLRARWARVGGAVVYGTLGTSRSLNPHRHFVPEVVLHGAFMG